MKTDGAFEVLIAAWPIDVQTHLKKLLGSV